MADDDFDDDDTEIDGDDENTVTLKASDMKGLRRQAKAASKATSELRQAKKELAFLKAGVDVDTPIGKLFTRAYDSDDLDIEAIQVAAREVNALRTDAIPVIPAESSAPVLLEGETDQAKERQALANGGLPDEQITLEPNSYAIDAAQKNIAAGMGQDDARAEAIDDLMFVASTGDKRVIWQGPDKS